MRSFTILFITSIIFLLGCGEDENETPELEKPWELYSVEPGNFTINSAPVTLNDGTRSGSYPDGTLYYNTYVLRERLPSNVQYEYYTIRAYVPTNDTYGASVSGFGMSLYHGTDSQRERLPGDENQSSTIGVTTLNGLQYSVFEIVVRDPNYIGNKTNVDQMIFAFNVSYFDRNTNNVLNQDLINLEVFTDTDPSSGSGNSDTGTATFWVNQDYGCGFIDVSISGYGTQKIDSFFGSNPGCTSQGSANFTNLPFGTYNYSASGSGCSWSNSFTLNSNCSTIQLTL